MQDYVSERSGEEIDAILDDVANKVDKVKGKGLSSEDFTTALKNKLELLQNYDDTYIREVVKNIIELTDDFNQDIANLYSTKQDTCYILPFDLVTLKRVVLGEIDAVAFTPDIFDAIQKNTLILLPKVIDETNGYQVVTQANYYADDVEMYLTIVDDEYDIHISGIFNNGNYLITLSNIVLIPKQKPITDLDAIREGAAKGKTSVQGVVVNNKQLTPDTRGNISLPAIPTKNDIANMGFTQNKGTVTGVLVNGESKSPNSAGIVDLGEIKVDEVKFANDLTGVVEATPEMFTYRPSAGNKSVRDESAVIRRIKGNTSVWGQTIIGLNEDSSVKVEKEGDAWVITPMGNSGSSGSVGWGSGWATFNNPHPLNTNHIYLCCVTFTKISKRTDLEDFVVERTLLSMRGKYIYLDADLGQRTTAVLISKPGASGEIFLSLNDCVSKIENPMLFDLTAIFGAGNEPTTYDEFRQCYPDAYYPYCEPEVRSMRATGIETIGFNAFNGEYAEVIGGHAYYLGGAIDTAHFATEINGERTEITIPESRLYTPSESGYIYATGSDICINLSHSGVRNGEYEPYEKNTLQLPEIAKYFPDGIHSIGDVYDEINEEMAIQRCAVRAYEEGDENNAEVKTDKTTTVYKLSESIYTPIDEPLQLAYKVDDFGTEMMLSDTPSSPFKADIVYQFNAEGRIRDNSRNIEKLERLVKQTTENFATKDYVEQQLENVQKGIVSVENPTIDILEPNKIYVYATYTLSSITINSFSTTDALTEEYVVQFRTFPTVGEIKLPSGVMWANGVTPTLEGDTLYELSIVKTHISGTDYFKAVLTPFKV